MILKLKRKFILINMALVLVVLLIVFSVLCLSTYRQQLQSAERALDQLLLRSDDPASKFEISKPTARGDQPQRNDSLIAGFVVVIDASGEFSVSASESVSVSDEIAQSVSETALQSSDGSGLIRSYSLRYMSVTENGETRIAFVDVSDDLSEMAEMIVTSLLVGVLGIAAFFLISLFLANWALRPVAKAWSQQKQFVADASHELKTPLTVILANQKILLAHPERTIGEESQWIENTQSESNRMKSLVEDMLFLAKSDSDQVKQALSTINFSDLVQGTLLSFASVAFEANVQMEDEIQSDVKLSGSEAQLRRLCAILFDNAVKYAGRGGAVHTVLHSDGTTCRLSVQNTGTPISEEDLPHLFERFYRADRARSAGGFGLGLSIAESIVHSHGGRIWAISSAAEGTTFNVVLPVCAEGKHRGKKEC